MCHLNELLSLNVSKLKLHGFFSQSDFIENCRAQRSDNFVLIYNKIQTSRHFFNMACLLILKEMAIKQVTRKYLKAWLKVLSLQLLV